MPWVSRSGLLEREMNTMKFTVVSFHLVFSFEVDPQLQPNVVSISSRHLRVYNSSPSCHPLQQGKWTPNMHTTMSILTWIPYNIHILYVWKHSKLTCRSAYPTCILQHPYQHTYQHPYTNMHTNMHTNIHTHWKHRRLTYRSTIPTYIPQYTESVS